MTALRVYAGDRFTHPAAASVALSITCSCVLSRLIDRVVARFADSISVVGRKVDEPKTLDPQPVPAPILPASTSRFASAMRIPAAAVPVELVTSWEMKARNFNPVTPPDGEELFPQELSVKPARRTTDKAA